jgi:hypothetical protein
MRRQGLNVSINELIYLSIELYFEQLELNKKLGIKEKDLDRKFLVNIINPSPNCSDTWKIETTK